MSRASGQGNTECIIVAQVFTGMEAAFGGHAFGGSVDRLVPKDTGLGLRLSCYIYGVVMRSIQWKQLDIWICVQVPAMC